MKRKDYMFVSTTEQKVLTFLAENVGSSFFDKEVARKAKVSRGATNQALRALAKSGLIAKETRGRMNFYQANATHPILKQTKVLRTVIQLLPMVQKLQPLSEKVILFGSASRGENYSGSDIDLFVLTHQKEEVESRIKKYKSKALQLITKSPVEFIALEKKDPIFYQEITRGIVLWEKL